MDLYWVLSLQRCAVSCEVLGGTEWVILVVVLFCVLGCVLLCCDVLDCVVLCLVVLS